MVFHDANFLVKSFGFNFISPHPIYSYPTKQILHIKTQSFLVGRILWKKIILHLLKLECFIKTSLYLILPLLPLICSWRINISISIAMPVDLLSWERNVQVLTMISTSPSGLINFMQATTSDN